MLLKFGKHFFSQSLGQVHWPKYFNDINLLSFWRAPPPPKRNFSIAFFLQSITVKLAFTKILNPFVVFQLIQFYMFLKKVGFGLQQYFALWRFQICFVMYHVYDTHFLNLFMPDNKDLMNESIKLFYQCTQWVCLSYQNHKQLFYKTSLLILCL